MKKNIKTIILIFILTLLSKQICFAKVLLKTGEQTEVQTEYSDVEQNEIYCEAVEILTALGVVNGYDEGIFNPDNELTRAEFTTMIIRMLCLENQINNETAVNYMDEADPLSWYWHLRERPINNEVDFDDVDSTDWHNSYIKLAYQKQLIKGVGDNKFAPNESVTYEQAVTVIVRALGYEIKASSLGGYPKGYLMCARQENITKNTENQIAPISRATAALLVYNALTVKFADYNHYYGSEYNIPLYSILYSAHNIVQAQGIIEVSTEEEKKAAILKYEKIDEISKSNGYYAVNSDKIIGNQSKHKQLYELPTDITEFAPYFENDTETEITIFIDISDKENINIKFIYNGSTYQTRLSSDKLSLVKKGMGVAELHDLLGQRHGSYGSGADRDLYYLEDGGRLIVDFGISYDYVRYAYIIPQNGESYMIVE